MKKDIIFTLPAEAVEGATQAMLLGDFNNWTPAQEFELEKQPDGSYKKVVQLEAGKTYRYRFLLNDGRWVNDYHAQQYVPADGLFIDNCVITVPEAQDEKVSDTPQALEAGTAAKGEAIKPAKKASSKTASTELKEPKAKATKKVALKEKAVKPAAEKGKAKKTEGTTKAAKKGTSSSKE